MHALAPLAGRTRGALGAPDTQTPLSAGMVFLFLFTVVMVGRIQGAFPALLGPLRIGLVTGCLAGLAWVLAPDTLRNKIPLEIKQVRYVLIFLGLAVITIPVSVWPGHSFEFVTGQYWKVVMFFLLVVYWCKSLQDVRRIIWACCLGVSVLVVVGLFKSQTGDVVHFSGTYDPNDVALVLAMLLPLALYLVSTATGSVRLVSLGMVCVYLYGIVATKSRGGFLALLAVGALLLWLGKWGRVTKVAMVAISLLAFGYLAGGAFWEEMETMWNPQTEYDRQAGGRTEIWKMGLMLMATKPWGIGIDGFMTAEGMSHGGGGKWAAAHNSFIQLGTELGIVGLVVFVLLLVQTIKELRAVQVVVPVTSTHASVVSLAVALEASLWGFIVGGFFLSQAYSGILYVVLALSVACSRLAAPLALRSTD